MTSHDSYSLFEAKDALLPVDNDSAKIGVKNVMLTGMTMSSCASITTGSWLIFRHLTKEQLAKILTHELCNISIIHHLHLVI